MVYKKFNTLLDPQEKRRFYFVCAIMVVYSFFESFSLSLLIPYIGVLSQDEQAMASVLALSGDFSIDRDNIVLAFSLFFLGVITVKSALQMYSSYQITKFPYDFYCSRSNALFRQYLEQDYIDFTSVNSNVLLKNCTHTLMRVATAFFQYLHYLSFLVVTIALFAILMLQNFFISSALIVIFSAIAVVVHNMYKKRLKKTGEELENSISCVNKGMSEALLAFKEMKIYQKDNYFLDHLKVHAAHLASAQQRSIFYPKIPVVVIEYAAIVLVLGVVAFFFVNGWAMASLVAPFFFYGAVSRRLLPAINQVISLRMGLHHLMPSVSIITKELAKVNEKKPTQETSELCFERSIAFHDVHFSYDRGKEVLKGIDLVIPKNHSVAFVGPSGAGKSTVVDMFSSLLHPNAGYFTVDGLKVPDLCGIRNKIGYVPQTVAILNDTIAQNIAFGCDQIDAKRLEIVIRMSHLDLFIKSLPQGVNTLIGERGIKLSGGQKQRVAIARALYSEPEILIFDEATSSLDNISESIISQAIAEMSGRKTIIAIAHRLTTVQEFDLIYILDDGKVVAQGTHEELLEKSHLYQKLAVSHNPPRSVQSRE